MRILITGAAGQLGRALTNNLQGTDYLATDLKEMDITSLARTKTVLGAYRPHAVIHCAAYTSVDAAEEDPAKAYAINAAGTQNVAAACHETGAKMIYVSTDYVFDGRKGSAYSETDRPNPLNAYGRTKLAGETLARRTLKRLFIARTSWLYGDGANFVRTMLALGRGQKLLRVVDDQIGCPTYAVDVAKLLLHLATTDNYGIYHVANRGQTSWWGFARRIFEFAGLPQIEILPVTTAEFCRPAIRPACSVLGSVMLESVLGTEMRPWEEALREYLACEGYPAKDGLAG